MFGLARNDQQNLLRGKCNIACKWQERVSSYKLHKLGFLFTFLGDLQIK